jgi:hypothetical protein
MCARDQKWAVKRKHTQPSTTRKEKYPMERKEKKREAPDEGERNN